LNISPELLPTFRLLMSGLCLILAITFSTKIFSHLLMAHQRFDVINYSQMALFAINYLVQWFCLRRGLGVFSILYGNAAGWLLTVVVAIAACLHLKLFPAAGMWGKPTWGRFREIFVYGKDVFWVALGSQLIVASQTIIVTRTMGLNAAATWSVCTRIYALITQLIFRLFDYSAPALAEMITFNERARLCSRVRSLVVVSTSLAVIAAGIYAACNQPFVAIWTHGRIGWSPLNDALLGFWLVLSTIVHSLCGFVLTTKAIRFMRYIYLLEGFVFVVLSNALAHFGGFSAIIAASIVCTCLFTLPYGIWRTGNFFGLSSRAMFREWIFPSLRLLLIFVPLGLVIWHLFSRFDYPKQILLVGGSLSFVGALLFLRYGLHKELKAEIHVRAPDRVRPMLASIMTGQLNLEAHEI